MFNRYRTWCCLTLILLVLLSLSVPAHAEPQRGSAEQSDNASVMSETRVNEDRSKPTGSTSRRSLSLSELMKKYPDTFRTRGPREKKIALTFDDVPDPRFTGKVLDVLKEFNLKATFFVVGERAKKHPGLVKRIQEEGHAIGNHSYNHPQLNKLSMSKFKSQIERTNAALKSIVGFEPRLIRPPYGEINEEQLRWARKHGYKVVNWNVDSLDWKGLGRDEVKQNILAAVSPGSIVLQHAGGGVGSDLTGTIEALPDIITELRARGYSFATLPEMLGVPEQQ